MSDAFWKKPLDLQALNAFCRDSLVSNLGIEFTEFGDDYLRASMPVDSRTMQPLGHLHGGATAALLETVANAAGIWAIEDPLICVGVELNINHLKAVASGVVTATAKPLRIGGTLHVWNVDVHNAGGELTASGRMTLAVRDPRMQKG